MLTYAENLDETSVPDAGDYALAGTAVAVDAVDSVSGNTVTLGLDAEVTEDETGITLDYTAGVNPVRDVAENEAANLNDYAVTNNSTVPGGPPPDVTAPQRVGNPVIASDGLSIAVTYDETLAGVPVAGDVTLGGTPVVANSSTGAGTTVWTIGVDSPIYPSETVTLTTANGPTDAAANEAATMSGQATANNSTAKIETFIDTLFASDAAYAKFLPRRARQYVGFACGGGGEGDNNANNSASGGGGACATTAIAAGSAVTTADIVVGAAGTGGVNGGATATDGADITVTENAALILRAKAGTRGIHGASPTAGTGGLAASCVGDSARSGGNGTTGATAQTGGGGAGSSTAASGTTAGDPDGGQAGNANQNSGTGGSVATTGTLGNNGGAGRLEATISRLATAGYPYIGAMTRNRDSAAGTTRNITIPSGSGGSLIVIGGSSADTDASISGWTEFLDAANAATTGRCFVFAIDATGSESVALVTAASTRCWWVVIRVLDGKPIDNWSLSSGAGSAAADPPSHTRTGGSAGSPGSVACLGLCGFSSRLSSSGAGDVRGFPTGFEGVISPGGSTSGSDGAVAFVRETNSAKNPGAFTMNNASNRSFTLDVPWVGS